MRRKKIVVSAKNKPNIECLSATQQKSLAVTLLARILILRAEQMQNID